MVELYAETQVQAPNNIPNDYVAGYENARQVAAEMAANYVAHTLIGDPLAEAMTEDLAELEAGESMQLIQAAMEQEGDGCCETHRPHCGNSSRKRKSGRNGSTLRHSHPVSACFIEVPG